MSDRKLRCAIYTRKSSDEGLEQEFNSLHAQREACEAYIRSQVGEGWRVVRTAYDDGGFSGGSMQRPGLKALLADLEAGLIDVVVVYKVDRLTRSLTDFSRIVEAFDKRGVSFVSITQSFNTTTSMGRLTLNVLLSFAQFEREVTGERIRDKIAASKAKGIWMGGMLPLGYDATDRKLVVNVAEARRVVGIFERYLELGSVHALKAELDREGAVSKAWQSEAGKVMGGLPFSRGALFQLLKNPLYIGKIRHKAKLHLGQHQAIVATEIFEKVQAQLATNAVTQRDRPLRSAQSWLTSRIFDGAGRRMCPSFGYGKSGRPFRYYITPGNVADRADDEQAVHRVSAPQLEELVEDRCRRLTIDRPSATDSDLVRVEINSHAVGLVIRSARLVAGYASESVALTDIAARVEPDDRLETAGDGLWRLRIAVRPVFRGGRTWLVNPKGGLAISATRPDPALIKALKQAHQILRDHDASPLLSADALRAAVSPPDSHLRRIAKLAFLAPDIQMAILEGRQPPGLCLRHLLRGQIPVSWVEQRRQLI